jgi:hypothetical protein
MGRKAAFRLAALLLLMVMGGDAIACEFFAPDHFESFRVPGNDMRLHQSHDHCICCCTHILAVASIDVPEPSGSVGTVIYSAPGPVVRTPDSVYHPPKA